MGIFAAAYGLDAEGRAALDRMSGDTEDGARKITRALQTVAPLPLWGVWFLAAAALQVARQPLWGHTIAVPLWLMWGLGAVLGLASGSTTSPSASIALTGMIVALAGMHCAGLVYRRDERQARKQGG